MIGKYIRDGDIVVLEHGPDPRSSQNVAALIDGTSMLKTFAMKSGKPLLKAGNTNYPALIPSNVQGANDPKCVAGSYS
jgi:SOS-response transcriptional repressor LexA